MKSKIEDLLAYIDDVESHFHVDNFFDEDNFTEAKLFEEYIIFLLVMNITVCGKG